MAKLTVKSGSASRSEYIFINDASSTTGAGLTGLVFNSAGLTAYYVTERGTPTAITLVTLASATAAYTSGGFIAVDATNMPGVYRVDIPSAVFATTKGVVMLKGATNMVPVLLEYDVVSYDPTDTVRLGLTSIPNVAQGSAGAIPTGSATGQVTVATNNDKTGYSLTQAFPTNFSSLAITVGGAVTAGTVSDKTGYSLSASQTFSTTGSVGSVTGNLSGSVGSLTATAVQNVWDDTTASLTTVGSIGKLLVDNINATISSRSTLTDTQVWASATRTLTSGANIALAKGTGITGFNDITAQSVWDILSSVVSVTGSIGLLLKTNIDAAISSRMATFSLPTNFSVLGITAGGAVTAGTVNDKTGYSLSSSQTFSTTGSVGSVTNPVTAGTVSDKTGYSLSQSFPANFSALSITAGTGYVTSTNGGGGGGGSSTTVRPGPFLLRAGNGIAGDPLDIQKGSVASIDLQCVDANSTGVDITGATVTTKVYNTAGTLVATYTNTSSYSAGGRTLCPLDATVTGTAGTYTANVWVVSGSTTTIYGPLRLYVRDI